MNTLIALVLPLATDGPKPEDVKAGWTAFTVFLLLLVAVGLLGWSLARQLKKANRAREAGILPPGKPAPRTDSEQPQDHQPQP